jgi:hypothetical protein
MSPLAKASTMVFGMMFIRKSVVVCACALAVYCSMDLVSSVAAVALKPAPGLHQVGHEQADHQREGGDTSKYSSALPPTRPIFFTSCMPAMPDTTVQKITGAMIILISLMKPSPSGFMATPPSGRTPEHHAAEDGEQHLHVQDFIKGFSRALLVLYFV